MKLNDRDLQALCDIAERAGAAIMEVYAGAHAHWTKDDASPLTEADVRADAIIRAALEAAFSGVPILSEESRDRGAGDARSLFLVDPLDGTKEFLNRNGEFTVNIARIEDGRPAVGVVFAPAAGELFYAGAGLGAWRRAQGETVEIRTVLHAEGTPLRVIGSRSHGGAELETWLATLTGPYSFVAAGSSLKICRVAEGAADLYPRFGLTSQWDTAAAQCVLEQAGGVMTGMDREPLHYGMGRPILNPWFAAAGDARLLPLLPAP